MPEIDNHPLDRLAGIDVDKLDIDVSGNTLLTLSHVATDIFAFDIYDEVLLTVDYIKDIACSQYGPSVTSGQSTHVLLLSKRTDGSVSAVRPVRFEACEVLRTVSTSRFFKYGTASLGFQRP